MKHACTNRSEPFAARMVRHSSERCLNREPSTGERLLRTNAVHGLDLIAVSTPQGCSACLTKPSNEALLTRSIGVRRPVERVSPGYFALRVAPIAVASCCAPQSGYNHITVRMNR